jgi:8-amino-7-oxononanoate synthase
MNGRELICFVGANYLGLQPTTVALSGFGLSVPRAIAVHAETTQLESAIARLVSCESALLSASTLQALCDVVGVVGTGGSLLIDEDAYPLTRAAAERARGLGITTMVARLRDVRKLDRLLSRSPHPRLVICESLVLPGIMSPLPAWIRLCETHGATLALDDTQGFGLLGRAPSEGNPFGIGGTGSLDFLDCARRSNVLLVSSLSKAFGVPLAFTAGRSRVIEALRQRGLGPWSSSQPDLASVRLALQALAWNAREGDCTRRVVADIVREFRATLHTRGMGLFPVQSWYFRSTDKARLLSARLYEQGIWAMLHPNPPERPGCAAIRFFLTAAHRNPELTRAMAAITRARELAEGSNNWIRE